MIDVNMDYNNNEITMLLIRKEKQVLIMQGKQNVE